MAPERDVRLTGLTTSPDRNLTFATIATSLGRAKTSAKIIDTIFGDVF
jgi:hypothetical protein